VAKTSPVAFFRQVRAEMAKVTWPTRRETGVSTVMVIVMVILAGVFLSVADLVIRSVITGGVGYLSGLFR